MRLHLAIPPVFRLPGIGCLGLILWGVNVWVFQKCGIKYAELFRMQKNSRLRPWEYISLGSFILALLTGFSLLSFHFSIHILDDLFPFSFYFFIFLAVSCPFNILWHDARMELIAKLRSVVTPSVKRGVSFSDHFVADILTSLSKGFADIALSICLMVSHATSYRLRPSLCTHLFLYPLLASLPFIIRIRQCHVEQVATGKSTWPNMIKYLTAFPVIWSTVIKDTYVIFYPEAGLQSFLGLWLSMALFHSLYAFVWDVWKDWGMFEIRSGDGERVWHLSLRRNRIFRKEWVYWAVIVADFALRISWGLQLSHAFHLSSDEWILMAEVAEVLRRFLWAFFRVEWAEICSGNPTIYKIEATSSSEEEEKLSQHLRHHPVHQNII